MAQFSIRQSIKFAFTAYAKHWMVLLGASVLLGLSGYLLQVAPRMVAQRIGAYQAVVVDQEMDMSQPVMQRFNVITAKLSAHIENAPKHLLLLLFLVLLACWIIHVFFMCGLIRVSLRVKDKDAASLELVLEDKPVVFNAMGVIVVVALYAICMLIGIAILSTPVVLLLKTVLGAGMIRVMMGMTGLVVVLFAFTFWVVGYMFTLFCVVDKPKTGVRAALVMSKTLVSGLRVKLIGALFILSVIVLPLSLLLKNLLMMGGVTEMALQHAIAAIILSPIMYLYLTYIYRNLNSK